MGNRFDHLDHFLPPTPGPGSRGPDETESRATPAQKRRPARVRTLRLRRAARWVGTALTLALAAGSVALVAAMVPARTDTRPDTSERAGVDVSLGADLVEVPAPTASSDRLRRARREGERKRSPRRYHHRLQVAVDAPGRVPDEGSTSDSIAAGGSRSSSAPKAPTEPRRRKPEPPRPPAPPQTPLFHCVDKPGSGHYMTIDQARAGQLSAPRSGWKCTVTGQVYAAGGPGRVPIELDDGTAYVLERRVSTDPESELVALYRHWVSYDWYYSDRQADGGLVGFVAR